MKARLRQYWESRTPLERAAILALSIVLGASAYGWLLQSAGRAREQLSASVSTLRAQAARLERQATEYERLRAAPAVTASQTDLRTLVQHQADSAGLSGMMGKLDATNANQVQVVFGAVPFADWLDWVGKLQSQQARLDACRIEALSTAGLVSVAATFVRAQSR